MINGDGRLTGVVMTENGPISVGHTDNEQLLIGLMNQQTLDLQRMNTLLDQADAILRRNHERVEKVRKDFSLLLLAAFTAGFGVGISLIRIFETWRP